MLWSYNGKGLLKLQPQTSYLNYKDFECGCITGATTSCSTAAIEMLVGLTLLHIVAGKEAAIGARRAQLTHYSLLGI